MCSFSDILSLPFLFLKNKKIATISIIIANIIEIAIGIAIFLCFFKKDNEKQFLTL